jgi:TRAP-type C4-dicarboxylate transport system permease small subunit
MRRLAAIYDRLLDALAFVSALALGAMAVWVTYEVIARKLFRAPTIWAVDLSEYTLVWTTFLAAPWVLRRGGHVTIDLVVNALPDAARRRLDAAMAAVGALVCAVYCWNTAASVIEYYQRELIIRHLWEVPQYIPYIAIPVGTALLTIEFIRRALTPPVAAAAAPTAPPV